MCRLDAMVGRRRRSALAVADSGPLGHAPQQNGEPLVSNYELLKLDVHDYIATVTLDRPPVNALSMALYKEIRAVFDEISERADDVRVAVLTASGKYFCVGRDMKQADNDPQEVRNAAVRAAFTSLYHCAVPVIAAVNGAALGGGLTLVLDSDIIIASELATFGLPEINAGLCGGMALNRRGFNQYQGRKLYFTGDAISAAEMYRLTVVDQVTAPDELLPVAHQLAAKLAAKSPVALRAAKWSANEVEKILDFEQAYRAVESRVTLGLAQTEDHKEAVRAFQEKRPPVFHGR
jgi:enoyl-CoA hydratase